MPLRLLWCARCHAELWEPLTTDPNMVIICGACAGPSPPPPAKPLTPEQERRIAALFR